MFGRHPRLADRSQIVHPDSIMPDVEVKTNSLYPATWHLTNLSLGGLFFQCLNFLNVTDERKKPDFSSLWDIKSH